ncbi:MAG TPA: DUF4876 domain-containing protein [Gemmatimonadales bacterium]|nr:DUF4876 domain-containing protein [Gemmatimonadales bacterium]
MSHPSLMLSWWSVRRCVCLLAALGPTACLGDTQLVSPPRVPPTTVTLEFRADSEDLATATALGWANGIPGVAVTLAPADSTTSAPQQLQGSDSGTLAIDQLAGGRYVVDAVRWLTDTERARLPTGDDAVGFVARVGLSTATTTARMPVRLVASRRRGLVISEFKGDPIQAANSETYLFSGYLRLYNNADSTIYLDGLIIGSGLAAGFDYPNFPCSLYLPYALDPLGVWANWFHQLPGRGTDYPLLPGESAVLATDAIDHRPLYPIGLDLSQAGFEFYAGAGDVDNPAVPNAADVGVRSNPSGHGLVWSPLAKVAFVARPFDLTAMRTEFFGNGTWARIPASAVLDVMAMKTTYHSEYPECDWLVHPNFDRLAVRLLGAAFADDTLAYRRLELPFTIGGRTILQYTRTSAWDFTTGRRDPFATP